jgi:hypothetical protein
MSLFQGSRVLIFAFKSNSTKIQTTGSKKNVFFLVLQHSVFTPPHRFFSLPLLIQTSIASLIITRTPFDAEGVELLSAFYSTIRGGVSCGNVI